MPNSWAVFPIDIVLLGLVTVTAFAVMHIRNLFAASMLAGIYSLLMSVVWVNMYAMDVAFTEAAVGAGISTVLFVGTLVYTGTRAREAEGIHWPAMIIVGIAGSALIYGTLDMPAFGDANAPVHSVVARRYINQNVGKDPEASAPPPPLADFGQHVPNKVTAVLADYRGYDTLFETAVIFTAGICVILLLRRTPPDGEEAR